jgi:hypothetical protein
MFGGTNPIAMSEYYNNNASGFTTGVTGIPNTGATISISQFYGKAKPSVSNGSLLNTTLQNIYAGLQPYLAEYKNANFYEYALDGDSSHISDGGGDMYDAGNFTQIIADGVATTNLSYNTTTETSVVVNGKTTGYISLGYNRPLIMLGKSSTRASWGFQKTGNLGADGSGSYTNFNVYTGTVVNGFTVYAWCRHIYNAYDPSIADLYFAIGDSSSTFYTSSMTVVDPSNTDNGLSSMRIDCVNVLFGCILCSKPSGLYISAAECQAVLTSLINRLKPVVQTTVSAPGFSIASIANLVLWHNGYNIDGSNNSTLSSGSTISSWYNSGTDASLTTTQSTSSAMPTYTQNGAVFSSGKSLISNINLNSGTYTIMNLFIVWKKTQSSNTLKWLWSQDDGGYDRTLIINTDSSLMVGRGDGGAEFPNYSFPINSVVVVNCEYNSSGQIGYFFVNNTSLATFTNLTASGTATTQFGSNGGGSSSIDGVIHEVLIISRVLTTTERTNIYNALLAKY